MLLRDLINALEPLPRHAEVRLDNGNAIRKLMSYRGNYSHLTLDNDPDYEETVTVANLLEQAFKAIGGTFEGYKGGDYVMHEDTPVHAQSSWSSGGLVPIALELVDDKVVIHTIDITDYV